MLALFLLTVYPNLVSRAHAQEESITAGNSSPSPLITLKLAKQMDRRETQPYSVQFPDSCKLCAVVNDPIYTAQNPREIDFAIRVPRDTAISISVHVDPSSIRRVLLEGTDLAFERKTGDLRFTLPPQSSDRINSAEFHTHIVYRGLDVRFEHADPDRRAAFYTKGEFPSLERSAAANLEFAQREAIFMLGLDTYVADEQIGTILLMGFDTNEPHGHTDSPPHMHMHMRWPQVGGTQIGHYYIGKNGLLTDNKISVRGWVGGHISRFMPGETFTTFDLHARPVYEHTITKEGWLNLGRAGAGTCAIRPLVAGDGFQDGAKVSCPGFQDKAVRTSDDIKTGKLTVAVNDSMEVYRYDPDTGLLLPFQVQ
jgi:hypothetical protein